MKRKVEVKPKRRPWSFRKHMEMTTPTHWATYEGVKIAVKDMEDSHLVNTVKLLRRHATRAKLAECFITVLGPRPSGDGATLAFEQGLEELAMMSDEAFLLEYVPPYKAMLARYRECETRLYDKQRADLDASIEDSWGDS